MSNIDYHNLPLWSREWSFLDVIDQKCKFHDVNPYHIIALIKTESNGNHLACRYEANFKWTYKIEEFAKKISATKDTIEILQKTSFGLGQVMGVHFFELKTTINYLEIYSWPTILFDVNVNLEYTIMIWKKKFEKYGLEPDTAYAAYNAGCVFYKNKNSFEYVNQSAVDKYMENLLDTEKRVKF
jgi:hypothetical protein